MAIIGEPELLERLSCSKNVLLIEPPYVRHYIPLGLAKISSFVKANGGEVRYSRAPVVGKFDLICVASVFTTDADMVINTIRGCRRSLFLRSVPVVVGGIFASLMPEYIMEKTGADVFIGFSGTLDDCLPDYAMDYGIEGFWGGVMTLFTTRGCPNHCGYCVVRRIEPGFRIERAWRRNLEEIDREVCVISDNSFLNAPREHIREVVGVLNATRKRIIFNNGIDCQMVDDENAGLLASLKYIRNGYRTAFDKMSQDGHYQRAMERVLAAGLKVKGNSYTYVLFNFDDTPQEAYYRARECWRYGSNPYLMKYRPLNELRKGDYVGKYWTRNLVRAFSNYGQNFGYNRGDGTFESWVRNAENVGMKNSYKSLLTDEDWERWEYRR